MTYSNRKIEYNHVFEADIVSTDLTGPYSTKSFNDSFNGSKTFMLMDSKKSYSYGDRKKSDSIGNLKRLVEEELNPRNIKLTRFHSNNARELIGLERRNYLKKMKCYPTSSTVYTPQENSFIERLFRHENEAVSATFCYAK